MCIRPVKCHPVQRLGQFQLRHEEEIAPAKYLHSSPPYLHFFANPVSSMLQGDETSTLLQSKHEVSDGVL